MAQPELSNFPAAEAGTGPEPGDSGLLGLAHAGQPQDVWPSARPDPGQHRMLDAIRSVGLATARTAPPRAGTDPRKGPPISAVLALWRATERELGALPEGSPDRPRLRATLDGLRSTYQRLFAARRDGSSGP